MTDYQATVTWFDGLGEDEVFDTYVQTDSMENAARVAYDTWSPTGWDEAVIHGGPTSERSLFVDLSLPEFNMRQM